MIQETISIAVGRPTLRGMKNVNSDI